MVFLYRAKGSKSEEFMNLTAAPFKVEWKIRAKKLFSKKSRNSDAKHLAAFLPAEQGQVLECSIKIGLSVYLFIFFFSVLFLLFCTIEIFLLF